MTKTELIELVKETLIDCDQQSDPILVDFTIDEIYWDKIAVVAVETITNSFEEVPWELQ